MKYQYNMIILGAGSAGLTATTGGVTLGARVMLIENNKMGGDCLNYGCIPSKTFLKSARLARLINKSDEYGLKTTMDISVPSIMKRVKDVVAQIEPHDSKLHYEKMGVDVRFGEAKIVDCHTVMLNNKEYTGKSILIATGTKAIIPPIKGLEYVNYHTNESIFALDYTPKNIIVLGAGPIGVELGQGFVNTGSTVDIIDRSTNIFTKEEPEVEKIMEEVFKKDNLHIHLNTEIMEVNQIGNDIIVTVKTNNQVKKMVCDTLLVALGRTPNTKNLGLEEIGVVLDKQGYIVVNNKLQTSIPNIFACGDVRGEYMFTHTAGYEGIVAIKNALIAPLFKVKYNNVAWATYTSPEVAHVAMTEIQAKEKGLFAHAIVYPMTKNDRSKTEDDQVGFVKVILDKKGRVIGGTIVSERAGELIATLALMVTNKMKMTSALSVIYPYPTQSEIFKMVALEEMLNNIKPWQKILVKNIVKK